MQQNILLSFELYASGPSYTSLNPNIRDGLMKVFKNNLGHLIKMVTSPILGQNTWILGRPGHLSYIRSKYLDSRSTRSPYLY